MSQVILNRVKAGDLELKEKVVAINRVVKTTKGGRAFSFSALVVVGNENGVVGHGLGKAKEVQEAITKGIEDAKKNLIKVPVMHGTIPHDQLAKEGAVLWRKHGGKVTYWTVAVGEVGNRVLSITFENFAAYGAAVDKMGEDKEVRAWQAKRMKAGYTTWVRSNMATEIEI